MDGFQFFVLTIFLGFICITLHHIFKSLCLIGDVVCATARHLAEVESRKLREKAESDSD
jgi:hypothetical protein